MNGIPEHILFFISLLGVIALITVGAMFANNNNKEIAEACISQGMEWKVADNGEWACVK